MDEQLWNEFESFMIVIANSFKRQKNSDPYNAATPSEITRDLKIIEKALTNVLNKLLPLKLQFEENQDHEEEPFNHPVVVALRGAQITKSPLTQYDFTYPTKVIDALIEFRELSQQAIKEQKSKRGNSARRNKDAYRKAQMAWNFVFHFRATFHYMPPISATGPTVELFESMLVIAGVNGSESAAELLRTAIESDPVRHMIPSKRKVKTGSNSI